MRIALFSECYFPVTNGVVTSIMTLRETLRSLGHSVFVFAPGTPQPEDDADIFRLPELPFPRHPYHLARPFLRMDIDFAALQVDIVHCQHPFTVGWLGADTARRFGLPMVYTAHSLYDAMVSTSRSPLVRTMGEPAARSVVRRFCAHADYVIAPTQYTRDALRSSGVAARFAVVPSGVLSPEVHPEMRNQLRSELQLQADDSLVLYVGRLGPEKRLDILLRSVAMIARQDQSTSDGTFRVALVGDGQMRSELEQLTADLNIRDKVLFVGNQPHSRIGDWYAASDIFVFPSPLETQGLVLIEAMAAGLPCIAVDRGGPREIVAQRVTGLRTAPEPASFARALDILLRSPEERQRLGANGRIRARAFSPEAMAKGVLQVYDAALRLPQPLVPAESALQESLSELQIRRDRTKRTRPRALPHFTVRRRDH